MNIDKLYPSKYLKSSDIEEAGGELILTITEVGVERMQGGDSKPVIAFEGEKPLVLNVTNKNTIKGLYGDETDHWKGKKISLHVENVTFRGESVAGIRVKDEIPELVAATGTDDDLPF